MVSGLSSGYAMAPLQARGVMFIEPSTQGPYSFLSQPKYLISPIRFFLVYPGMIIGECNKPQTLHINPCLKKQLSNFRNVMAEDKIVLGSPRVMGLEEMLSYMSEDEMVEVVRRQVGSASIRAFLRKKGIRVEEDLPTPDDKSMANSPRGRW